MASDEDDMLTDPLLDFLSEEIAMHIETFELKAMKFKMQRKLSLRTNEDITDPLDFFSVLIKEKRLTDWKSLLKLKTILPKRLFRTVEQKVKEMAGGADGSPSPEGQGAVLHHSSSDPGATATGDNLASDARQPNGSDQPPTGRPTALASRSFSVNARTVHHPPSLPPSPSSQGTPVDSSICDEVFQGRDGMSILHPNFCVQQSSPVGSDSPQVDPSPLNTPSPNTTTSHAPTTSTSITVAKQLFDSSTPNTTTTITRRPFGAGDDEDDDETPLKEVDAAPIINLSVPVQCQDLDCDGESALPKSQHATPVIHSMMFENKMEATENENRTAEVVTDGSPTFSVLFTTEGSNVAKRLVSTERVFRTPSRVFQADSCKMPSFTSFSETPVKLVDRTLPNVKSAATGEDIEKECLYTRNSAKSDDDLGRTTLPLELHLKSNKAKPTFQEAQKPVVAISPLLKFGSYSALQQSFGNNSSRVSPPVQSGAPVTLYAYQLELARSGVEGQNCIICAPTGSGKTLTAAYICERRRERAKGVGGSGGGKGAEGGSRGRFKALFVVCIRNLIQQQRDAICRIIREDNAVAAINDTTLLSDAMKRSDVTVLTAQILVNCLRSTEVRISNIDLLIMDECHHTDLNHPYNHIMKFYHEARWARTTPPAKLPQIVGLTASLGVGGGGLDDTSGALAHYVSMCANLDCRLITHVRPGPHLEELLRINPRPQKDQIVQVDPRRKDHPFTARLHRLMEDILSTDPLVTLPHSPAAFGTQQYENWVVLQRIGAESEGNIDRVTGAEALIRVNTALMCHDELQAKDALFHLDGLFKDQAYLSADAPTHIRLTLHGLYATHRAVLQAVAEREGVGDSEKLDKLCGLLEGLFENDNDTRGIVLTRTRQGVEALERIINDHPALRGRVYPAKLVGQGQGKAGTMTDKAQEQALRRFRRGRQDGSAEGCNLLIATDVAQEGLDMPKCSFVIRYNFVSNEIGSVQSRGRARAPNSECYLIVDRGSVNEKREFENLEKEHMMMEALEMIDRIPPEQLRCEMEREQERVRTMFEQRERENEMRTELCDARRVIIHCRGCNVELCRASDICLRGSNYICTLEAFIKNRAVIKPGAQRDFRLDKHIGLCHCANPSCNRSLGPAIEYKHGARLKGYALSKDAVVWSLEGEPERNLRAIKKWTKVPFKIVEEKMFEGSV